MHDAHEHDASPLARVLPGRALRIAALSVTVNGTLLATIGLVLLPGFLGLTHGGGQFAGGGSYDATLVPTSVYGVGVGLALVAVAIVVVGTRRRDAWTTFVGVLFLFGAVVALAIGHDEVIRSFDVGRGLQSVPVRGRGWLDVGLGMLESAVVLWAWVGLRARRQARRLAAHPAAA